jgi:hypothetical protein
MARFPKEHAIYPALETLDDSTAESTSKGRAGKLNTSLTMIGKI